MVTLRKILTKSNVKELETLSISEEQFKRWKPAQQNKWIKDHPNSKFAKKVIKSKNNETKLDSKVLEKSYGKSKAPDRVKKLAEGTSNEDNVPVAYLKTRGGKSEKVIYFDPKSKQYSIEDYTDGKARAYDSADSLDELKERFNRFHSNEVYKKFKQPTYDVAWKDDAFNFGDKPFKVQIKEDMKKLPTDTQATLRGFIKRLDNAKVKLEQLRKDNNYDEIEKVRDSLDRFYGDNLSYSVYEDKKLGKVVDKILKEYEDVY